MLFARSTLEVSRIFNIPCSTLQKRLKLNCEAGPSLGGKPIFIREEEKTTSRIYYSSFKTFYCFSREETEKCAYPYVEIIILFVLLTEKQGDDWRRGFIKTNSSILLC